MTTTTATYCSFKGICIVVVLCEGGQEFIFVFMPVVLPHNFPVTAKATRVVYYAGLNL